MSNTVTKNLINGEWVVAASGKTITVTNPFDGSVVGSVPDMAADEVELAINAAYEAQNTWGITTAYYRSELLARWAQLIQDNLEELSLLMTLECGKSLVESRGENLFSIDVLKWFAEEAKRSYGRIVPSNVANRQIQVIKQPVGVSAMITPWNFPGSMITRKAGAALAAGCTVVLKPDHRTPLIALEMAKLAQQAGFPNGVLNVITGDAPMIGQIFCTHPLVKKISFTGSTTVGKILLQQAAPHVKKLSLELGGNAPFIVFPSVSVDEAVAAVMVAKLRNSGQSCVSANRIYVHETMQDAFVMKLKEAVANVKQADGKLPDTQLGTLIDEKAVAKIDALVRDAITNGATCYTGGAVSPLGKCFYQPTILTGVTDTMRIAKEEIFGPVFAIQTFAYEDDVVRRANDSVYGLAAYVMTHDLAQAARMSQALDFGMVGVNAAVISFSASPFGGFKESGQGRESGIEGLQAFQEIKTITIQN